MYYIIAKGIHIIHAQAQYFRKLNTSFRNSRKTGSAERLCAAKLEARATLLKHGKAKVSKKKR